MIERLWLRVLIYTLGLIRWAAAREARAYSLLSSDKAAEFLAPAWTCRPEALMRDTGWRPETDLDTGLRRTAQWYRKEGWL